jgi:baseplate J-like protein
MPELAPPRIDYTKKDYQSLVAELLDVARERLPQWTDRSPNDVGVVLTELFAYMGDMVLYYTDRALNEGFLDTAVERRSLVNLLRLIGYELRPSRPASADIALLFDPDYPETITVPSGAEFDTQIKVDNKPIRFRYLGPELKVDTSAFVPTAWTDGKDYRIYEPLPVVQVDQKIDNEIVGSSDGSANQQFRLAKKPLIEDSLVLRVDEGGGPVVWERKDTLLQSLGSNLHFTLRHDADEYTWLAFGDNRYGRAPRRGFNNITADYMVGGGIKGNVPVGTIAKAVTTIARLKKTWNAEAANGGMDMEAVEDAAVRAPRQFRSMDRAVTTQDYESHALSLGVGKARARAASWNRIELFIAPAGGGFPTDTQKQDLLRYFEQKRMLTSIVDVLDPVYVPVSIRGDLEVEPYVFRERVQQAAEAAIQRHMSFEQRRFQDVLYVSKIYEAIEAVPGVNAVNVTQFSRPGTTPPPLLPQSGKLTFDWDEIPVPADPRGIVFDSVTGGVGAS